MTIDIIEVINMNTQEFCKTMNELRLGNKGQWVFWQGTVNDRRVAIKFYDTYIQVYRIDDINYATGVCDISVRQFKLDLLSPFDKLGALNQLQNG